LSRIMAGLLAAVGAAMACLAGLIHGDLVPLLVVAASAGTGIAAYLALPSIKKNL